MDYGGSRGLWLKNCPNNGVLKNNKKYIGAGFEPTTRSKVEVPFRLTHLGCVTKASRYGSKSASRLTKTLETHNFCSKTLSISLNHAISNPTQNK